MKLRAWLLAGALVAALVAAGAVYATVSKDKKEQQEEQVTIDQVPAAVKATIQKEAGTNKITEIEKETTDGKVVYEAEWKADGKEVEITVAEDGTLLAKETAEDDGDDDGAQEEKVTIDQVPAAVKATIQKEAGANKITEIEKETTDGKIVYEAEWKVDGKEVEITVAEDGTLLGKESKEDDGDDD